MMLDATGEPEPGQPDIEALEPIAPSAAQEKTGGSPVRRFGMFSLIGMTGFAFQTMLIALLTRVSGWHYAYVVPATAEVTVLLSFLWHVKWTWADRPMQGLRALLTRLFHYQVARTAGIVGAYVLTLVIVSSFDLVPEIANTLAVATMSIVNFAIADRIIFRPS